MSKRHELPIHGKHTNGQKICAISLIIKGISTKIRDFQSYIGYYYLLILFTDFRERKEGGERRRGKKGKERGINLLFHLLMYSLVDSCMCSDQGSNLQPRCIGTTF